MWNIFQAQTVSPLQVYARRGGPIYTTGIGSKPHVHSRLGEWASGREINNITFTIRRVIPSIPLEDTLIAEDFDILGIDIGIDHYVGLVRYTLN
jgi:hypothetical protein